MYHSYSCSKVMAYTAESEPEDQQDPQQLLTSQKHLHQQDDWATLKQQQLFLGLLPSRTKNFDSLEITIKEVFGKKSPVSMLMEFGQYLRQGVKFCDVADPKGPDHCLIFTIAAVVGRRLFSPCEGKKKKDCRTGAAYLAWTTLLGEHKERFRAVTIDSNATWCQKVAAHAHLEYLLQVEAHPQGFCGRKVLAAMLLKKKQSKGHRDIVTVISLGTGNRTILSNYLEMDGTPLNDCHAELIARRAFVRFLYRQMQLFKKSNNNSMECVFEKCGVTGKLKLKSCYTVHLYISTSPCGDAALFNRTEDSHDPFAREPIFDSKVQGLLRTKIEAGEGTIPVENGYFQTWIGLKFGKRLHTMSCSDKICKWNVLGLQGTLLSHFLQPVYLSSLTIGDNFCWGHIARALYFRLTPGGSTPDWDLPFGYRLACVDIGYSNLEDSVPETEKSSSITLSWTKGDDRGDVLDGTTGTWPELDEQKTLPKVCKRSLYEEFRALCSMYSRKELLSAATYRDSKMAATEHQHVKDVLFKRFERLGYGTWVHKPPEVDYFTL